MPLPALIPLALLIVASLGCATYYTVVATRILRILRRLPSLRDGRRLADQLSFWPTLCVVVPAHNEEGVIATLIRSLKAQDYPKLRVVLALDRCTDRTEPIARDEIAGDERFEIITIDHCPDEWAGKVNAAHQGVTRAAAPRDAEVLLFTDADTWFDPPAFRAAVALLNDRHLDLLSLLPTLTRANWFERVVQPAAGFELMRRYPLDRLNRGRRIRFANGQFMLFKRDTYERLGGHEAVRHELLEDLAFARLYALRRNRTRHAVLISRDLFHCRMYADWPDFRRGWKRIYTESSHRAVRRLRRDAWRVRFFGTILPLIAVLTLLAAPIVFALREDAPLTVALGVAGLAGLVSFALAAATILRIQGLPVGTVPVYPIGAWLTGSILAEAGADLAAGRKTEWGGRTYTRQAR